jgi:SPW repeat-containing protein
MERWRSQTNLLNAMFGLLLFVSPWLLGFSGMGAWNAWISGAVLIAVSMTAITYFAEWEEWVDLALGAWILAAPWTLNFPADSPQVKIHILSGGIVVILAAVELWQEHHGPPQVSA